MRERAGTSTRRTGALLTALGCALLALLPAAASAADPGRWNDVARSTIPLVYFQGVTSAPDGDLFFDGINVGLYRTDSQLRAEASNPNAIPPQVGTDEKFNHIGDITYDASGNHVVLPLECYYPGTPGGANTCLHGGIAFANPDSLQWESYWNLAKDNDTSGEMRKAMWAEISPDGQTLWTQGSTESGGSKSLLGYDMSHFTADAAADGPNPQEISPSRVIPNALPSGQVTGAAFYGGRIYLARSSHTSGQATDTFQVYSLDLNLPDGEVGGSYRLEIEKQIAGESEGLDVFGSLGGRLHWQIQPIPADLVNQKPTYEPGKGSLLSFVPDSSATDIHDTDDDGFVDANDLDCPTTPGQSPCGGPPPVGDEDLDQVSTTGDNCPSTANNFQANADQDSQGDACDADDDGDGVVDAADDCQYLSNADQLDTDRDGSGDACEDDDDNDTFVDWRDNCPVTANPDQADADGDGIGDACEQITPPPPADTTAPQTTIGKVKVKGRKATIAFSSSEPGSRFACELDGKKLKKCSSPLTLKHLKPGKHRFEVAAIDVAGNRDASAAKDRFTVKGRKKHRKHK